MIRTPETKVIFLHIPKTGGSSVSKSIGRHYRRSRFHVKAEASWRAATRASDPGGGAFEEYLQTLRSHLLLYAAETGNRYLTGHVWYTDGLRELRGQGYKVMSCLRDPVDRMLSHYLYNRYKSQSHMRTDQDIEAFLISPEAARISTFYVKYLGGIRSDGRYDSPEALGHAKASLEAIDCLGFLDDLPGFMGRAQMLVGRRLYLAHERKSPAPDRYAQAIRNSQEVRERVAALCTSDLHLYDYARSIAG